MQNIQGNRLGLSLGGNWLRHLDVHPITRARCVRWFDGFAIDPDVAILDETLDRAARKARELGSQPDIEALTRERVFDGNNLSGGRHRELRHDPDLVLFARS